MQGQGGHRRPPRTAREPRTAPAGGPDVNRERLVYCITKMVGQRVSAKLRNNVEYEGVFHSCSPEGDFSITLKCATRVQNEGGSAQKTGDMVNTLVIAGKDFLQVTALNLTGVFHEEGPAPKGFATDAEIAARKGEASTEKELVPWVDGAAGAGAAGGGLEDGAAPDEKWDQFKANESMYGVSTTFKEELYTTKLDPAAIPKEQREKAEKIAREIESGRMNSEMEGRLEGEDEVDEETRFSAVQTSGAAAAQGRKDQPRSTEAKPTRTVSNQAPLPQMPQARDLGGQQDALSGPLRDMKKQRGMISEMKRINALNLEPTLPKPDGDSRRISFADAQARNARLQGSGDLKSDFQQSLALIQKQEESKQRKQQAQGASPPANSQMGPGSPDGQWANQQGMMMQGQKPGRNDFQMGPGPGDQARTKQFSFNTQAKPFSLNPQAGEFTPGGGGGGGGGGGPGGSSSAAVAAATAPSAMKPAGPQVQFQIPKKNPDLLRKDLNQILDPLFNRAKGQHNDGPQWPDATGPSFHEVLGQPNAAGRPVPAGPMGPAGGNVHGGQWQQGPPAQPQVPPMGPGGAGPQMMQNFVAVNAPQGPAQQQYMQMGPCAMYPGPGGGAPGQQGQQGGAGGMPPQGQQQQPGVFGQQTMMAQQPNQQMAMMGPVPKYGGQGQQMVVMPVMLAPGQQQQMMQCQGFVPQAMQGQPGQTGPPGPPGPHQSS